LCRWSRASPTSRNCVWSLNSANTAICASPPRDEWPPSMRCTHEFFPQRPLLDNFLKLFKNIEK
jgi:hypothetical protein